VIFPQNRADYGQTTRRLRPGSLLRDDFRVLARGATKQKFEKKNENKMPYVLLLVVVSY
jgi:hypothetical protein